MSVSDFLMCSLSLLRIRSTAASSASVLAFMAVSRAAWSSGLSPIAETVVDLAAVTGKKGCGSGGVVGDGAVWWWWWLDGIKLQRSN